MFHRALEHVEAGHLLVDDLEVALEAGVLGDEPLFDFFEAGLLPFDPGVVVVDGVLQGVLGHRHRAVDRVKHGLDDVINRPGKTLFDVDGRRQGLPDIGRIFWSCSGKRDFFRYISTSRMRLTCNPEYLEYVLESQRE